MALDTLTTEGNQNTPFDYGTTTGKHSDIAYHADQDTSVNDVDDNQQIIDLDR